MLKMSSKKLRGRIQTHPEKWVNVKYTNSYAYALGLDIEEAKICKSAYVPGTISSYINLFKLVNCFPYSKLVAKIEEDLTKLNISYRRVSPTAKLQEGEWRIALFIKYYDDTFTLKRLSNYKFLRENLDGTWSYKYGYYTTPSDKDCLGQIIEDPRECNMGNYKYKKCYALRLNR